jgi:hypothetical protein
VFPKRGGVALKRGVVVLKRGIVLLKRGGVSSKRGALVPKRGVVCLKRGGVVPKRGVVCLKREAYEAVGDGAKRTTQQLARPMDKVLHHYQATSGHAITAGGWAGNVSYRYF